MTLPIANIIYGSFIEGTPLNPRGITLENWIRVFTGTFPARLSDLLLNTITFAIVVAITSTFAGFFLAYLVVRTDIPFKRVIEFLSLASRGPPLIVYTIAWVLTFSPRIGIYNQAATMILGYPLFSIYSFPGMVLGLALYELPVAFLMSYNALKLVDPSLEEQALICGGSNLYNLVKIVMPILKPLLLSQILLISLIALSSMEIPVLLGMPGKIYLLNSAVFFALYGEVFTPQYGLASSIGSILVMLALPIFCLYIMSLKNVQKFVTVGGRAKVSVTFNIGKWKYVFVGIFMSYFIFLILVPLTILVLQSFSSTYGTFDWTNFTIKNWVDAFNLSTVQRAFQNSIFLAIVGATLASFICFFISYSIVKIREYELMKSLLQTITLIPFTLPSVVLALGFIWAYIKTPIYATIWMLLFYYILAYLPFTLRNMTPFFYQIHPELEEAAMVSGGGFLYNLRKVLFPLIKSGIVAVWIIVFQLYLREFAGSILLYRGGSEVLATEIYVRAFSEGMLQTGAVLGVTIMVISLLIYMSLIKYFRLII